MVEDMTGLGIAMEGAAKIADSQIANKVYDDGLQGPTRQVGSLATELLKSFRLVTFPLQLLAVCQDRLEAFCDRVRAGVPEERQVEARPEIAGPILMEMRFIEDASPLAKMYEKLLQKAIDRDYQELAHPAFAKIIAQLSHQEVVLINDMKTKGFKCWVWTPTGSNLGVSQEIIRTDLSESTTQLVTNLDATLGHLINLGLVAFDAVDSDDSEQRPEWTLYICFAQLTSWGKMFLNACGQQ